MASRWPWLLGGIAVLAAGGAGFWLLSRTPEPEAQPAPPPPLIETAQARAIEEIALRQTAFLRPVAESPVLPETTARILAVSPEFDRGRRVAAGTVLVTLDPTQVDGDVARAEAALAEAEAAVTEARIEAERQETLEDRAVVAETVVQGALVALASAEARLDTARVQLRLARDAQADTEIVAPFDALITEVAADPGELVGPTTVLGQLVSAEAAELEVGILPRDLAIIPGGPAALPGAKVRLRNPTGGPILAEGVVASVETGLSEGTRLLPLVVRVPDPFAGARPLRLDALLLAELPIAIEGDGALALPSRALKPGGRVWAVRDDALVALTPELLLRQDDPDGARVILRAGDLRAGEIVMLTDLPAASEGQAVRTGEREDGEGGS
ncbi:MAG: efflux RND transporter periplasmic adaptor subunit [Pseudomonadota bacterium]